MDGDKSRDGHLPKLMNKERSGRARASSSFFSFKDLGIKGILISGLAFLLISNLAALAYLPFAHGGGYDAFSGLQQGALLGLVTASICVIAFFGSRTWFRLGAILLVVTTMGSGALTLWPSLIPGIDAHLCAPSYFSVALAGCTIGLLLKTTFWEKHPLSSLGIVLAVFVISVLGTGPRTVSQASIPSPAIMRTPTQSADISPLVWKLLAAAPENFASIRGNVRYRSDSSIGYQPASWLLTMCPLCIVRDNFASVKSPETWEVDGFGGWAQNADARDSLESQTFRSLAKIFRSVRSGKTADGLATLDFEGPHGVWMYAENVEGTDEHAFEVTVGHTLPVDIHFAPNTSPLNAAHRKRLSDDVTQYVRTAVRNANSKFNALRGKANANIRFGSDDGGLGASSLAGEIRARVRP